jgi:hypothetical protein
MPSGFFQLRSKRHLPRAILYVAHSVGRVAEEIQNDLLKLNAVTVNSRQLVTEFLFENHRREWFVVRSPAHRQYSADRSSACGDKCWHW